jgi:hypothetical protein
LAISLYERGAVTAAIQEITFVVESPQDFSEKKDAMRLLRKWAK